MEQQHGRRTRRLRQGCTKARRASTSAGLSFTRRAGAHTYEAHIAHQVALKRFCAVTASDHCGPANNQALLALSVTGSVRDKYARTSSYAFLYVTQPLVTSLQPGVGFSTAQASQSRWASWSWTWPQCSNSCRSWKNAANGCTTRKCEVDTMKIHDDQHRDAAVLL